jgi:peptidoglycan/xylan/chitin deacetylase (PgdA/CDA1 family)
VFSVSPTEKAVLAASAAAGAAAAIAAFAALAPQSQLFGRTLVAGNDPGQAALTFDDGPNEACTPQLLELLAKHNVTATFFMMGRYVRRLPELVREVQAAGHIVGNHTETHPWLAWQSDARIREELRCCNEALEDALGTPVRWFRPPHGARRPYVLRAARALGLTTVQWNVMGKDWKPIGPQAIAANVERGMTRARARGVGSNILLHDGSQFGMGTDRGDTLRATALLLERLRDKGIRFVPLRAWDEAPA